MPIRRPHLLLTLMLAALSGGLIQTQASADQMDNSAAMPAMEHHHHDMDAAAGTDTDASHDRHDAHQDAAMTHDAHNAHQSHMAMTKNTGKYTRKNGSYTLPKVKLLDMAGQAHTLSDIIDTDKPLIVNFIFTTCTTICPIMSATFSQAQDILGPELETLKMVSISIDPEQDTPEALLKYALKFQASPAWDFYTGKIDDINATLKAFDVYRGDKMNHIPVTLIRAKRDASWVRLEGLTSAKDLVMEYHQAIGGEHFSKK